MTEARYKGVTSTTIMEKTWQEKVAYPISPRIDGQNSGRNRGRRTAENLCSDFVKMTPAKDLRRNSANSRSAEFVRSRHGAIFDGSNLVWKRIPTEHNLAAIFSMRKTR